MKIALVCPYDWSAHGGVRMHVAALAGELSHRHEVRVFAPASQPVHDRGVVTVGRPLPVRFNESVAPVALSPFAGHRVVAALRAFGPHIVHVHEPLVPAVGVAAAARGPRPVVATYHSWAARDRVYRLASPVGVRVARRLSARIAVSPAAQQYAGHALGLPLSAFKVIPNGVDPGMYARATPVPGLADPERPLVLFLGRLEPRKGLDVAIRAFLRLRVAVPRARLCVVGDGPERDRCQQMVPAALRPDVLFVGRVSEADKPRYHASADVFVSPAVSGESFGIVLLEAMAAGLPVVASDLPGHRAVITDGRQGRLVPPGDALALTEALTVVLRSPALARAFVVEGRRTAQAHAWPNVAVQVEQVYRAAYRQRRAAGA